MTIEITKEHILNARTYLQIGVKARLAEQIAGWCVQPVEEAENTAIPTPPMYKENRAIKNLLVTGILARFYLNIDFECQSIRLMEDGRKMDRYKKSCVYITDAPPPKSAEEHARIIKARWRDYMLDGCKGTFIILDARSYGQSVVEQLHRDLGDGLPPLATITHEEPYNALEQEGAIACIYPIQATGMSGRDPNAEMLDYIEREVENGNLLLLTANIVDATKAYKLKHNITDDNDDAAIQHPYLKTNKLCQQIANLQKKYSSVGWTEKEISERIPKDEWSALLYASRLAQRFEKEELYYENRTNNEWEKYASQFDGKGLSNIPIKTRNVKRLGRGAISR